MVRTFQTRRKDREPGYGKNPFSRGGVIFSGPEISPAQGATGADEAGGGWQPTEELEEPFFSRFRYRLSGIAPFPLQDSSPRTVVACPEYPLWGLYLRHMENMYSMQI